MTDSGALVRILKGINADEIYHLAAQSHVGISFENPLSTCDINALGSLRLLEAVRLLRLEKKVKFYSVRNPFQIYGFEELQLIMKIGGDI